ncbi:DUF317 domain-containing protein [Kitasatospora sp. NPDC097605]|uniref:DUF317 domain-containing protein n=1 Tax=Kitasatospora sp. NPDC097605 TaxID=3157226 RepID=UPI00331C9B36
MTHPDPLAHNMPMVVFPGYLAGPGEGLDAIFEFGRGRDDWLLTVVDDHLVAGHESTNGLVMLNQDTDSPYPQWNIGARSSPTAEFAWRATFDAPTPAEVVLSVARRLAHSMALPTRSEREQHLWSRGCYTGTHNVLRAEAAHAGWTTRPHCRALTFDAPDGTATLRIHHSADGHGDATDVAYTLTAGARGHEGTWWTAEFSRDTPTGIVLAALRTVTNPGRYTRRAARIPMRHRAFLRTHPVARRGQDFARGR